jgi:hypothetical protein
VYWYFYDENAKLLGRLRELEDRESSIISEYEAKLAEKQSAMEAALARLKRDHEAALLAQMKEHNDAMASAAAKHAAEMQVLVFSFVCLLNGSDPKAQSELGDLNAGNGKQDVSYGFRAWHGLGGASGSAQPGLGERDKAAARRDAASLES